uniref:DNA topoisomerase 2 n=1 Tax=Schistocephalus solidus TaxID=70667 RepID=A0A0X3PUD6_SCHSO
MADIQLANGDVPEDGIVDPAKKRLSVERIYQKKTQLEHILIRPDTYIGSVERATTLMWLYDKEKQAMIQKEITYTPGLYKIYDEILVNAADNKVRDPSMNCIKIDIKAEDNLIRIWNNGAGIPVVHHRVEKMFVPSLIFGHLLTSSNYDDTEKKVTGGRNGFGAKLCNIFSRKFVVETSSKEHKKCFKQTWIDNMTKTSEPRITASAGEDFTCISFYPDLARFGMTELEADTVALFERRAYDIAASTRGVKVILNGVRVPIKNFKDYVDLYLKDKGEDGEAVPVVYECVNPRWEVAVAASNLGFQQVSFVNSIATTKGGKHIDYISDQVANKLVDVVKKKSGKSGVTVKSFQIRSHMWVFVNCLIENPSFDSQTKEFMTLQSKSFGSTCVLSEKFINQVSRSGIVENVLSWVRFKAQEKMDKQCHKSKHVKLKGIPKLDDANDAGTKNSAACTLILTEGDSAKTLAVAGLSVVGRDRYGVFPLRGKLLNVREASSKQIMENAEINNLIKILGLQYKNKYETPESVATLRYGKIMIMTDQDQDGSHIKGLLISFIHHNWPKLLHHNFLEEFITPIVKVFKGKQELAFYSIPEFEEWQKTTSNWHTWRVKYYKGLGTSTSKEAKDYFSDMTRHRIRFRYSGPEDDASITLAFNKNKSDDRKSWLTTWMNERKRRVELGLPEDYLYGSGTHAITYSDFVHKELILFSNMDNERSIPSLVDGLKPGQRKVLYTCLKRNLVKEIKVAQLSGSVAEMSSYHHGEASLMGTIIGLAQDFVGSNNLNLLMPHGQFGTRLSGGKDAASPRYIFTSLSPFTRKIFSERDDAILHYLFEDNQRIEPYWYIPVIPMVLINGADGIGTGWGTKIPNYDVMEVISNLRRMIDGADPLPMLPSFRDFRGVIQELGDNRYVVFGEIAILDEQTVEITELPVRVWTQSYKEGVLEVMLNGSEKVPASILDYKEYHTDATVRFVVRMTPEKLREAEAIGLHKFFKLSTAMTTNSMVLFDHMGCVKRYASVSEILKEFFELRLEWYNKRKSYLEGMLSAEARRLENQARFVLEKIQGKISIENRAKRDLIRLLKEHNYEPDPVHAWKECIDKLAAIEDARAASRAAGEGEEEDSEEQGGDASTSSAAADYNYILGMPLWSLTKERKDDLLAQRDKKQAELTELLSKSARRLWRDDLDELEAVVKKYEEDRQKDMQSLIEAAEKKMSKQTASGRNVPSKASKSVKQTLPDPLGKRIVPVVDPEHLKKVEAVKRKATRVRDANAAVDPNADDFLEDLDDDSQFGGSAPVPLLSRLSGEGMPVTATKPASSTNGAVRRGGGRGRGRGHGAKGSSQTSPVKRPRTKKAAVNSSGESDANGITSDEDFEGFKAAAIAAGPVRSLPVRSKTVRKYDFDSDSDADEDEEETSFSAVDHGQGDKELELPKVEVPTVDPAKSPVAGASKEKSSNPSTAWPIRYEKTANSKSTRGGSGRGRGRGGAAAGGGSRGGGTKKSAIGRVPARGPKIMDSDVSSSGEMDNADDIFKPGSAEDSPQAPIRPRVNPLRPTQKRSQYVFDSGDSEQDGDADEEEDDYAAPSKSRKKARHDSDDDYRPE